MTDAELDAALQALTAIDVDPRLAARVVDAIEPSRGFSRRTAAWPAVAGLAAAAMVVIALAGLASRVGPGALPQIDPAPPLVLGAVIVGRPAADFEIPLVVARDEVRHARTEAPWPYSMPALEREPPLAIDPIRHARLSKPPLAIEPLSIDQIELQTLDR